VLLGDVYVKMSEAPEQRLRRRLCQLREMEVTPQTMALALDP
jgi:hypothetical protein